jgi:hypothetical protein
MNADAREQLAVVLDSLAGYNDKGFAWSGHDAARVEAYRAAQLAGIRALVAQVGRERLPAAFLDALDDGRVATDFTGRWGEMLRR